MINVQSYMIPAVLIKGIQRHIILLATCAFCAFAAKERLPELLKVDSNPHFEFAEDSEKAPIMSAYYLAKYPVTNADYARFCKETHHTPPGYWQNGKAPKGKENHPVVYVSLRDAEAYCAWLTEKSKTYTFRLPSEAEWEYAASGKNKLRYPWGNDSGVSLRNGVITSNFNFNGVLAAKLLKENPKKMLTFVSPRSSRQGEKVQVNQLIILNENGGVQGWQDHKMGGGFVQTDLFKEINDGGGYTTPVNFYSKGVSPSGCWDMSGNAWEWTSSVVTAKNGAERGQEVNAIRGGSWYATSRSCAATFRGEGRRAEGVYNTVGFRVAADKKKQ